MPAADSGAALMRALRCGACHEGVPAPAPSVAPPFGTAGARFDPAFVFAYLARPRPLRQGIAPARMPDFRLDPAERLALTRFIAGGRARTGVVARFLDWLRGLGSGAGRHRDAGQAGAPPAAASQAGAPAERAALDAASRRYPEADSALGRRIFIALNCAACHAYPGLRAWKAGPPLGAEGARVTATWLRGWLADPTPIRPFGFQPGTGSRMPDYHLSVDEVDAITASLMAQRGGGSTTGASSATGEAALPGAPLTAFDRAKVTALLRGRLPCLGCHRIDGEGGRVGPDLSAAGRRLQPDFILRMILDPQATVPGSAMPRVPMPTWEADLLARDLAGRVATRTQDTVRLSLARTPLRPPATDTTPAQLYLRFCSACHGADGRGDGYNARFLPVPPADHASAAAMSALSDDMIYDAIAAGGYIMNRSPRMPPFGETLTRSQIHGLVGYIRTLCRCQGPAWSRDGGS